MCSQENDPGYVNCLVNIRSAQASPDDRFSISANKALRHWVILRSICHGTRTEDGTRILAILISVIETCRVRQHSPWIYLAAVIRQRRAGFLYRGFL